MYQDTADAAVLSHLPLLLLLGNTSQRGHVHVNTKKSGPYMYQDTADAAVLSHLPLV